MIRKISHIKQGSVFLKFLAPLWVYNKNTNKAKKAKEMIGQNLAQYDFLFFFESLAWSGLYYYYWTVKLC